MGLIGTLFNFQAGQTARAGDVNAALEQIRAAFDDSAVLTDLARLITVAHTINPSVAGPPLILGANALNQKVVGLNADQLDGLEAAVFMLAAARAAANGVAPLGADSKVPVAYLPDTVLGAVQYKGTWDASGAAPAAPEAGDYYVVSVAGATSLSGITDWKIGDWAIYSGTAWQKIDNTDLVSSVAGKQGVVTLNWADLTDTSAVLNHLQALAMGGALQVLRVNAAGTGLEFSAAASGHIGVTVYKTGTSGVATGGAISWNAERDDTSGFWTSGSPTIITIPIAGKYDITPHTGIDFTAAGQSYALRFERVSGGANYAIWRGFSAGNGTHHIGSEKKDVDLLAGDYTLRLDHSAGGSLNTKGTENEMSLTIRKSPTA